MKSEKHNYKYEYLLYLALFGIALLFPFLRVGDMALEGESFQWRFIFEAWADLLPFAVLLVVHTLLLLPVLLYKGRPWRYAACTFLLLCCFGIFTYFQFRSRFEKMPIPPVEVLQPSGELQNLPQQLPSQMPPPQMQPPPQMPVPQPSGNFPPAPQFRRPPAIGAIPGPVFINVFFAIMLLGCNLAIRLMFKHYWDMRKMEELEKTRISPHFFLNSLNNIHGMVELDPDKAQEMILELSGMMRYVLYESSSHKIPLSREVDFIANYVALMRMRYTPNKVLIKLDLPDKNSLGDIFVAPLLFINFIENAFKHGVDYRELSFVEMALAVERGCIVFKCSNSMHKGETDNANSGIGLDNIRKRLDILYPGRYVLDIREQEKIYGLTLKIKE